MLDSLPPAVPVPTRRRGDERGLHEREHGQQPAAALPVVLGAATLVRGLRHEPGHGRRTDTVIPAETGSSGSEITVQTPGE